MSLNPIIALAAVIKSFRVLGLGVRVKVKRVLGLG